MEENKELNLIISELKPQQITIKNKDEIIKNLNENLVKYDRVLTEDTLKEGKEDKAELNKLTKAIEDKRKEIKKAVMQPYDEVEKDFKEITTLIGEASQKLDKQVKAFEEEEKNQKQEQINKLLKEFNTTGVNIQNEKWLNKTYKLNEIEQEIKDFVNKFDTDMEVLKDEDITIKDYYKRTLDISKTLIEKKRIEELRKQEEERKKQLIEYSEKQKFIEKEKKEEEEIVLVDETIEVKNKAILELTLTRAEAVKLKAFLLENNIEYVLKGEIQ